MEPPTRHEPSPLLGRERERALLREASAQGVACLTLAGPPGVGCSRLLAEALAHEAGPWLRVELADARSGDDLWLALARALELELPDAEAVLRALRRRALSGLALDNAALDPDALRSCVESLREHAPSLRLLVAARAPLGLPDERCISVGPLSLERPSPLAASPAEELLYARVAALREAPVSPAEHAPLREVARRLEGLPLALESAAASVATMGAVLVARHLEQLLVERSVDDSLARAVSILAPEARLLLGACSVFAEPFSVEAAQAVLAPLTTTLLNGLRTLVERGLLQLGQAEAEPHFRLHLAVRMRAADEALRGALPALAVRHARHFVALGEGLARAVYAPAGEQSLAKLERARGELCLVAERALRDELAAPDAVELGLRALCALQPAWRLRGLLAREGSLLAALLRRSEAPWVWHCRALLAARWLARRGGPAVPPCDDEALLERARAGSDPELCARVALCAAAEAHSAGDDRAVDRWLAAFSLPGDAQILAERAALLADTAWRQGRVADAAALLEEARAACQLAGNAPYEAHLLCSLGEYYQDLGRDDEASRCTDRATALYLRLACPALAHYAALAPAMARLAAGEWAEAERRFDEASRGLARSGDERLAATADAGLALARWGRGDTDGALALLEESTARLARVGEQFHRVYFGSFLVALWATKGVTLRAQGLDAQLAVETSPSPGPLREALRRLRTASLLAAASEGARARGELSLAREHGAAARALLLPDRAGPVDVRVAQRFARELFTSRADGASAPSLRVHSEGAWFSLRDGAVVRVEPHRATQRVLLALAMAHLALPGEPVESTALIAAGWPGERILPAAARNRLKVVMAWLRRAGLGALLLSSRGAYLLDGALELTLEP